jgi:phosphatidate cytidylyltransferase
MFVLVYLGVLASFLPHLRWKLSLDRQSVLALTIAIFVPKCCDIGAYFTGRLAGKHRMTPLLSPKKTWEGAAGGLALGAVVAVVVSLYGNHPSYYLMKAVALGVALSVMGMFGDLAESLLKRETQKKDASQVVPGFGGILDVVDSVLFAAPLSFAWLTTTRLSPLG